jgi:hypothetical protein
VFITETTPLEYNGLNMIPRGVFMGTTTFEELIKKEPCYFLGANSGNGFVNCFSEIYEPLKGERLYILKGGPGTGKSTLMKKMALWMAEQGQRCILYFCSSDPNSLDGVRFPDCKTAFVDGTAPHIMEPQYLGVSERIINVGDCLCYDKLEQKREEILPLYRQNKQLHGRASRYLSAAAQLSNDSYVADCGCTDLQKVEQLAMQLCKRYLPPKDGKSKETKCFLSGATPDGLILFEETLKKNAENIIAIEDEYGATASIIMSVIHSHLLSSGYNIITCPCALSPQRKIDHLIIPELQLAFCTTNMFLPITVDTRRRIHANRFRDMDLLSKRKQRLRFNHRAIEELLDGACHHIHEARKVHDLMEGYYIETMDFQKLDHLTEQIKEDLIRKVEQEAT